MDAEAARLISLGYNSEYVIALMERIKAEKKADNIKRSKEKKSEEKKQEVMKVLRCHEAGPRVIRWYHRNIKAKENIACDVEGCTTSAVRYIDSQYCYNRVTCYMCLSHYNTAHCILTDLP